MVREAGTRPCAIFLHDRLPRAALHHVQTHLVFHGVSRQGRRALRSILLRSPRGRDLIFILVYDEDCVVLSSKRSFARVVSNEGPVGPLFVNCFDRRHPLRLVVTSHTEGKDAPP